MAELIIHDQLAERLQAIAERENRPVEDVLSSLLDLYTRSSDAFEAMDGQFDDDVTDLSTSVRNTMTNYYQKKHGRSSLLLAFA